MRTLTLSGQIRLVENNLSPEERNARIDFYLSGHFQRQRISAPVPDGEGSAWQAIVVTGKIAARACPVPENAALCLQSFAERPNEYGVPCVTDAGTASISMGDLLGHNYERDGPFVRQLPLLMRTVENYVKSVIEFRVDSRAQIGYSAPPNIALKLRPCPIGAAGDADAGQALMEYIQSTMKQAHALNNEYEGTGNM
jgi:hypothetical protein